MNNVINSVAYLRTSREFTENLPLLCRDISKAYIDTANSVNVRTIGIFPTGKSAITGESWYLTSQKQQTLRQVYTFKANDPPTSVITIPHGLDLEDINQFVRIYGVFTDGTIYYPLPYVDVVAANNQVNVIVNSTNIVITGGGGGAQPFVSSGVTVLEWLSDA